MTAQQAAGSSVNILDKAIMLVVSFGRFGNRRKASLAPVTVDADKAMLSLSKRLLRSKPFDAIVSHDRETNAWLDRMALPFPVRNGTRLIPIPMISLIDETLNTRKAARDVLIATFIEHYESEKPDSPKAIAEAELRDLFNAADYPSAETMASRFSFEWQYLDYGVPGKLKSLNLKMYEAARAKMDGEIANATIEIQQALRAGMADLVANMIERLEPDAENGGKPKVFRDSLVLNMREFLDTFDTRNITNDAELAELVKKARNLIGGIDPKTLRKEEAVKASISTGFAEIQQKLEGLVMVRTRKINVDDTDEA